jgi:hypothetical protein
MNDQTAPSICVYCQALYQEPAERCPSCACPFPWHAAPSPTTSSPAKREPWWRRVAPEAAAFASVVSIITILVQTKILFQQTELLQEQTRTSQLDRAQTLRTRIAATHGHILSARAFSDTLVWVFKTPPACGAECQSTNFFARIISSPRQTFEREADAQASQMLLFLQHQLTAQSEALTTVAGTKATYGQFFRERLQPAITECGASVQTSKSLYAVTAALPLIDELVHGRRSGILDRQVALLQLTGGKNIPVWTTIEQDGSYTMAKFSDDLKAFIGIVDDSLGALMETCSQQLQRDQASLRQLEAQL